MIENPVETEEMMEMIRVGRNTFERLKQHGLPHVKIGPKLHLYYPSIVNAWLKDYSYEQFRKGKK